MTPKNTYVRRDGGGQQCRTCKARRQRALHAATPIEQRRAYEERRKPRRNARLRRRRKYDHEWRDKIDGAARLRRQMAKTSGLTLLEIAEQEHWRCYLCGDIVQPEDAEIEHIVALSRGGDSSRANVALAHLRCNRRKSSRPVSALGWAVPSAREREQAARSLGSVIADD